MFGNPDPAFLSMLTDTKLFDFLQETNKYRNDWKGHDGLANEQTYQERLITLKSSLSKIRQVISDCWEKAKIILPLENIWSEGVYDYKAKAVMGNRNPFPEINIKTLKPMDAKKLYLWHEGQLQPIELLPFFRVVENSNTQQSVCSFYNRKKNNQVKWNYYHYASKPSEYLPLDSEIMSALSLLLPATEVKSQ